MAKTPIRSVILNKYYILDPGVSAGDEVGGLRVLEDKDNDNALHILATPMQVQWWFDQGLLSTGPSSKLSGAGKKLLAQITRGRSEEPYETPKRVPKYSKAMQSGSPQFAGTPASARMKQRAKDAKKAQGKDKPAKKPQPKPATPPPGAA